ncbi:DUF6541 family protein [Microbacterium yannicii]|uniref:DUF6541 family protein n=1 Tax=Microbacterium yannicii TaxID=671622 RepID=UPI0020934E2F|nr:DUF6541 family protein [Microbacterium yannicii]
MAVVTVLLLLLIGVPLARLIGLRGFTSIAVGPAFTLTIICGASLVLAWLGIAWTPLGVVVIACVVGLVLAGARSLTRRWRPVVAPSPARRFDAWLLTGIFVAAALITWRVVAVIQVPDNISQTFDNVFHLNAVRWVLDTGSASALEIGYMTNPDGPPAFYPSGWHGLVALAAQLTGAAVPVAINGVVLAISAFVWPVGILLLCRTLFGRSPALSLAAGVAAASVPLPLLLMDYGVLYPFQLGVALLPVALSITARLLRLPSGPDPLGALWWSVALVGVLPGIALVHPGALMAWLALSAPMALVFVVTRWHNVPSRRARTTLVAATALYLLIAAAMVYALRPPSGARGWQPEVSVNDAIVKILTAAPWYPHAPIVVATAVVAGIVWAIVARTRASVTALGMYAVAGILFVVVAAIPFPVRDLFTAPWYNNIPRIAALLLVTMVPLAAYGATVSWYAFARALRRRGGSSAAVRLAGIAAVVVLGLLAQAGPLSAMPEAQRVASASFALTDDSPLLNSDEAGLIARLDEHVPADAVIAGSPWTGTSVAYALTGRHVLMPHIQMEISDALEAVNDDLNDATPGSPVCDAIAELNVGFVLDFGSREVHGANHVFPGLTDLEDSGAVRLVDHEGDARLYEVIGCAL